MQPELFSFVEWRSDDLQERMSLLATNLVQIDYTADRSQSVRREINHLLFEIEQRGEAWNPAPQKVYAEPKRKRRK